MTKELELNLKLDKLSDDERDQLMKLVNKAGGQDDDDIIWKPKRNEDYYILQDDMEVGCIRNTEEQYDKMCYNSGNTFRTKELAENMAIRKRQIGIFENKMMEFAEEYEYNNDINNYYIFFDGSKSHDQWRLSLHYISKNPTTIYMTKSQAEKAKDWANKFYPEGV